MVDGAPGYDGAASDPPCYNCGMRGHWFNACPEPTRKVPAGLEASLAARQNTRDGSTGETQALRRGKGPVITRYPLPPTTAPGISRYDPPSGVSLPPHPPPAAYHPPAPYHQAYVPPYNASPVQHYDPYHKGPIGPPASVPPNHYHHYQHQPNPYGPPHAHGPPPYVPFNDPPGGHSDSYGRPRLSPSYSYPGAHLPGHPPPPPPPPPHHHYPPSGATDYTRNTPPYSHAPPVSYHSSPPPQARYSRYSPPPYRDSYSRERSPRSQSRDYWQPRHYRSSEDEHRYRDREYERERPRYSPRRQSPPPRQRHGRERSPQSRAPNRDDWERQDRRRDKPRNIGGNNNNRKPEKDQTKQGSTTKKSEKHTDRGKTETGPHQEKPPASEPKAATTSKQIVQWGLVVPYMPVWDFSDDENEEDSDKKHSMETGKIQAYEEDGDLEWIVAQIFAEWVPYIQGSPISRPLPREYSEKPIPPPTGHDAKLQMDHITATNVDQFSMSIRETKEWRHKKWFPLFADPLEIHPSMLARLGDPNKKAKGELNREGQNLPTKKANGRQRNPDSRQDDQKRDRNQPQRDSPGLLATNRGRDTARRDGGNPGDEDDSRAHVQSPSSSRKETSAQSSSFLSPGKSVPRKQSEDQYDPRSRRQSNQSTESSLHDRRPSTGNSRSHSQQLKEDNNTSGEDAHASSKPESPERATARRRSSHDVREYVRPHNMGQDGPDDRPPRPVSNARSRHVDDEDMKKSGEVMVMTNQHQERPSSKSSLRSWPSRASGGRDNNNHHHHGSRRGSVVSDISRAESPLTPTEMALLGIEGLDSDDDDGGSDNGGNEAAAGQGVGGRGSSSISSSSVKARQSTSQTQQQQQHNRHNRRPHHQDETTSTPKSRPGKRQASAAAAASPEDATPRTKKRRQQVASAFSRRW